MDHLTQEFLAESQEGLERMDACVSDLEKRPTDRELISEMFRTMHTIKGTTGFLGHRRLEKLAHAGESLLGALRDGSVAVTSALIDGLLALMDGVRAILRSIETTGGEGARSSDDDCELLTRLAALKSPAKESQLIEQPLAAGAQQLKSAPAVSSGDASAPSGGCAKPASSPQGQARDSGPPAATAQDRTLRVDVEVLNRMMNLVGELVLTRNQILQSSPASKNFPELARRLDSVTADLREAVMQARMQPVGNLFGKFPRMVRDLAQNCGKRVRIEFEGQGTGLDKSLLEAIKDPLTHALRNSIDHGIERPEERIRMGKPVEGLVRLRAFQQHGSVVVEMTDDGGGISIERVLAKGIERGLVTPEQAATMSGHETLQLIFDPGFSTADQITHISGRGVGMDVVRTNVERVGGSVEVESQVGTGTTLRLRVPLTLAIVPALVVRSGGQSFALPQSTLVELVYVPHAEARSVVEHMGTAELYRLRDSLLPLIWLDRLLNLPPCEEPHGFYIAVVEGEGRRFGLVVDDLLSPEEIVVKPLSSVLREIGLFSGATVLGNGLLAMILDVPATGASAGLRPADDGERTASAANSGLPSMNASAADGRSPMLIYESGKLCQSAMSGPHSTRADDEVCKPAGERMGMPLNLVERIESLPVRQIEYAGGRPVLQYRGSLLPLEDEGGLLRELGPAGVATILICHHGIAAQAADGSESASSRLGIVVRRVLDVSTGSALESDPLLSDRQLALVDGRVVMLHREAAAPVPTHSNAFFKEVA